MKFIFEKEVNHGDYSTTTHVEQTVSQSSNAHNIVNSLLHFATNAGYSYEFLLKGAKSLTKDLPE